MGKKSTGNEIQCCVFVCVCLHKHTQKQDFGNRKCSVILLLFYSILQRHSLNRHRHPKIHQAIVNKYNPRVFTAESINTNCFL